LLHPEELNEKNEVPCEGLSKIVRMGLITNLSTRPEERKRKLLMCFHPNVGARLEAFSPSQARKLAGKTIFHPSFDPLIHRFL